MADQLGRPTRSSPNTEEHLPVGDALDDVVREVDARGLACPMPVIELARAIGEVAVGDRVRLLATDPAAKVDVPVWCRLQRHRLRAHALDEGVWRFVVERAN